MKKKYINITITIPEEYFDVFIGSISHFQFIGIEEKFDEIILSFDECNWNNDIEMELKSLLNSNFPDSRIKEIITIDEINWNEEWERNVPLIKVSENLGIAPLWKIDELKTTEKIIINPKMSFGTGDHPTTRLVCRLMERIVEKGSRWIDIGSGTGILSIYAVKLGAESVIAFDNSTWAVENSIENAKMNNVLDKLSISECDIDSIKLSHSNGILANLNLNLLKKNFSKFVDSIESANGNIIISGILVYDKEDIEELVKKYPVKIIKFLQEEEWIAYHIKYNG